jgi:hypothetical protein
MKKFFLAVLFAAISAVLLAVPAFAKTTSAGQTVGAVLFYTVNARGDEILVSKIPVSEMEADMKAGRIDDTLHNYSLLDKFVTTLHQEAQGFTAQEFIGYARAKSPVKALRALPLSLSGKSEISFWEIDQTGYDALDTYTYADLYETPRYNFPLLYEYWDYAKQDYYDPAGKLTREQVIDRIFESGEPETVILSVRAFSQRYMVTTEKFGIDYNMEGYWQSQNLLDNARTMRVMKPMTRDELYNKTSTAMDTRYWTANIRLRPENAPEIDALGRVAAPTALMTEAGGNYYIRFDCATPDATILYNHNFISPSYTPTSLYGDGAVVVPKEYFNAGTVTMTARAVKEGFSDAGVVTLTLTPSGTEQNPDTSPALADVPAGAWFAEAAEYVAEKGLFDLTGGNNFSPGAPMTRAMFVIALYRAAGSPDGAPTAVFSDLPAGTPPAAAVSWALDAGVADGMGDGSFGPDASVTREQIAAMLFRYARRAGADTRAAGDLSAFSDAGEIAGWARESFAWAAGAGLINGMGDGSVAPRGTATRAQVAQMLFKFAPL